MNSEATKEFVRSVFGPAVLVVGSRDAENVCQKNDLKLVDLLQPFSQTHYEVPSTTAGRPRSGSITLRFIGIDSLRRPSVAAARRSTSSAVMACQGEPGVPRRLLAGDTAWFDAYKRVFFRLIRSSEHEYFNHPVACVVMVSTENADPIAAFENTYNVGEPPRVFKDEKIHPASLKYHVLVHDATHGDEDRAQSLLVDMKRAFGPSACHLLVINSNTDPSSVHVPDLWTGVIDLSKSRRASRRKSEVAAEEPPVAEGASPENITEADPLGPLSESVLPDADEQDHVVQFGRSLLEEDIKRIQQFVMEFTTASLVPFISQTISVLQQSVSAQRKKGGAFLRRWFGSGAKPSAPPTSQSAFNVPVEQQMRKLGDYCFMLQDFETSYNMYHALKRDFSSEKAQKHYAGAQEMTAITAFMMDSPRTELSRFQDAIKTYGTTASIYAARATMIAADVLQARRHFDEAAKLLIRMTSDESDLRSGLLLEQASMAFLRVQPRAPTRRAALHLILAGHRYSKANQRKHAIRCYQQALSVYAGTSWWLAEDHIHFTVGRHAVQVGDAATALEAFTCLMGNHKQLPQLQKQYFKEFVTAYQQAGEAAELPLPLVDQSSIQLFLRSPGANESGSLEEGWLALEDLVAKQKRKGKSRVKSGHCFNHRTNNTAAPICVVDEPLRIQVTLSNPLHFELVLTDIHLRCLIPDTGDVATDAECSTPAVAAVTLPAQQSIHLQLKAVPHVEGGLRVDGMAYTLPGEAHGYRTFDVRGRRLNKTRAERHGVVHATDLRLQPVVMPAMPLLQATLRQELPLVTTVGQINTLAVLLRNDSSRGLVDLSVCTSHPHAAFLGTAGGPDACAPTLGGGPAVHTRPWGWPAAGAEARVLPIGDGALAARSETELPVHLCFATPGKFEVQLLFYYAAEAAVDKLPYRLLRTSVQVSVVPSVQLAAAIHTVPNHLDRMFLSVLVSNAHRSASVSLEQVSSISAQWALAADQPEDATMDAAAQVLGPSESLSRHVLLHRRPQPEARAGADGQGSSSNAPCVSTLCYAEPAVDIAAAPCGPCVQAASSLAAATKGKKGKGKSSTKAAGGDSPVRVVAVWRFADGSTVGHVACNAQPLAGDASAAGQDFVQVEVRHRDAYEHDFAAQRLFALEFDVVVRNVQLEAGQPIKLELLSPWDQTQDQRRRTSEQSFTWVGKTRLEMGLPEMGATLTVPAIACISGPGVYDLGHIRVLLPDRQHSQRLAPSLVTVSPA